MKRFFQFGNRTFEDYSNFLKKAKANGFEFVPLREFLFPKEPNERKIGLRHDVDSELNHALKIARIEHAAGIKSTYFILHTAGYYYKDISKDKINERLIEKLVYLQNILGHEIGLHTDLMPIELVYKKDPDEYLKNILIHLRNNGINITGVAPHGNLFHHLYKRKYMDSDLEIKNNNLFADPSREFDMKMFNLDYEAYNLDEDIYFSDAQFINYKRWDFSCIENNFFKKNGRTIILTHTIHWAPSRVYYFTINFFLTVRYFFSYIIEYINYRRSNKVCLNPNNGNTISNTGLEL